MTHQKIKKMLSTLVDGRLSSGERELVENHLAGCPECRALLKSFQQLRDFSPTPNYKVNPFFAPRVLATLKARKREGFWQVFDLFPRPLIVTGLVASVCILAIFAGPHYSPTNGSETAEFALLYGDQAELAPVTDDQALAIAINAETTISNGE